MVVEVDLKLFWICLLFIIYEARLIYLFNKIINMEEKINKI